MDMMIQWLDAERPWQRLPGGQYSKRLLELLQPLDKALVDYAQADCKDIEAWEKKELENPDAERLKILRQAVEKELREEDLKEVWGEIVSNCRDRVKRIADRIFLSIDLNGNRTLDLSEWETWVKQEDDIHRQQHKQLQRSGSFARQKSFPVKTPSQDIPLDDEDDAPGKEKLSADGLKMFNEAMGPFFKEGIAKNGPLWEMSLTEWNQVLNSLDWTPLDVAHNTLCGLRAKEVANLHDRVSRIALPQQKADGGELPPHEKFRQRRRSVGDPVRDMIEFNKAKSDPHAKMPRKAHSSGGSGDAMEFSLFKIPSVRLIGEPVRQRV